MRLYRKMKPRVLGIIATRMGSERLLGKVLAPIMNRPMLFFLIERIKRAKSIDEIVVATTTKLEDDRIAVLAEKQGAKVFRGSEKDVLGRVLAAAKKHQADVIVRVTGDNPLTDPEYIDKGVKLFLSGKYDYVANDNIELTMPRGLDVEIFSVKSLEKVSRITNNPDDREHVTRFFYQHPEMFRLKAFGPPKKDRLAGWHLAVDTKRDLRLIRKIFEALYPKNPDFSYKDIVNLLKVGVGFSAS